MTAALRRLLACALCAAACGGDDAATEVIVEIEREARVAQRSSDLRLRFESLADRGTPPASELHRAAPWPFRLALSPRGGDAGRTYRLTAEALGQDGEPVAAARLVSGFVAGERRFVRMVLEDACIGRACADPDQTCHLRAAAPQDAAACVDARVDAEDFGRTEPVDLGELLDRMPREDAGASDAGPDAAAPDASGRDAAEPGEDPCATDNGGCDPLSRCTRAPDGVVCGACPAGFGGTAELGCLPRLLDLTVSPGELTPAFAEATMQYQLVLSLPTERISITARAAAEAMLSIGGRDATSGEAFLSDVLPAGESTLGIELATAHGASAGYALAIARGAQQAHVKASNTGENDHFGAAVAIAGDTMVIGAAGEDGGAGGGQDDALADSGAAYVFVRRGGVWSQQAYLKADNAGAGDAFGHALAISGDTIVVAAPLEDSSTVGVHAAGAPDDAAVDSGAAYVFVRAQGTWTQQAYLKAHNTDGVDWFGTSVAIGGETIAVGARFERSNANTVGGNADDDSAAASGAAYVFAREGALWSQAAYLKPSNNGAGHEFGSAVAVAAQGDTVAVGAPGEDDGDALGRGAAYVFVRGAGGDWSQAEYLKAGAASPGEAFGFSVAISDEALAVGTSSEIPAEAVQNGATGAVHVFERAGGFATVHRLAAADGDPGDTFGHAVAVDGELLLVGAPREAGSARGVHAAAARGDNAVAASGAAYAFARTAGGWMPLAYLKASNAAASDRFGFAVAVSGGSLLVGSIDEGSGATGVSAGGKGGEDGARASGAAYVFQ